MSHEKEKQINVPHRESLSYPEYTHEVIEELRGPLKKIAAELHENIDNHKYSVIIGDDVSGRIPALAIQNFIRAIYKAQEGSEQIKTLFLAGSKGLNEKLQIRKQQSVVEYLAKSVEGMDSPRALLVTDVIHSGATIVHMGRAMEEAGIEYDIAATAVLIPDSRIEEIEHELRTRIYYGSRRTPQVHHVESLSGVTKRPSELHATSLKTDVAESGKSYMQSLVNTAREDINLLSKELFEEHEKHGNNSV